MNFSDFSKASTACFGDISDKLSAIRDANPLYFIPALAIGGAAIVFAYKKWGRWTERGMDQVFAVGLNKESDFPLVSIPMAAVSTWLTQLFGGSAGREGAAMQIGSALSYNISKKLPFENAAHVMLVTGLAAGFAGIFQAPMAATAFALEVLLVGHLELGALLPAAAAAFTACKVSSMLGFHKFSVDLSSLLDASGFSASIFTNEGALDGKFLVKLALMGVLFGIVGGGFAKLLGLSQNFFAKKFPNNIKRIAIMGVGISALLLVFFQGRYAGLGTNLLDLSFGINAAGIAGYDWILKFASPRFSSSALPSESSSQACSGCPSPSPQPSALQQSLQAQATRFGPPSSSQAKSSDSIASPHSSSSAQSPTFATADNRFINKRRLG